MIRYSGPREVRRLQDGRQPAETRRRSIPRQRSMGSAAREAPRSAALRATPPCTPMPAQPHPAGHDLVDVGLRARSRSRRGHSIRWGRERSRTETKTDASTTTTKQHE